MKHSAWFLLLAGLVLAGCNYDAPLTAEPTAKVDARLLGEWIQPQEKDWMVVCALDESHYALAYGTEKPGARPDLYRAHHSDFAGLHFISVQNLQAGNDHGRYSYIVWSLSADGTKLTLSPVSTKVVPESHADTAAMQAVVRAHAKDPALLNEAMVFVRPGEGN